KIISTKRIKSQYKNLIENALRTNLGENGINSRVFVDIQQFFDLVNRGLIDTQGIDSSNISEKMFLFLLDPEGFDGIKFNVNWLKKLNWDSFCERFSKIEYIKSALGKSLKVEFDEKLSELFFKMEKLKEPS